MRAVSSLRAVSVVLGLLALGGTAAQAAEPKVELGASVIGATIGLDDDNKVKSIGVPSGGFGVVNPGVYAALFVAPRVAIEPQLGFIWVSNDGSSEHILNFVAQGDVFLGDTAKSAPYVFGAVGVLDVSGSSRTPKSVAGGVGYRALAGERLTLRLDGRVTHFTEEGGNALSFGLSIGGLFGAR